MDAEAECQFRRYRSLTSTISTRFASATFQTCAEFLRSISFLAAAAQLKRRERTRWEPNLFSHQAANSRTLPPLIILFKQNQFILPVPCSCSLQKPLPPLSLSFSPSFLLLPPLLAIHLLLSPGPYLDSHHPKARSVRCATSRSCQVHYCPTVIRKHWGNVFIHFHFLGHRTVVPPFGGDFV